MTKTKMNTLLATTAVLALAACGGGGDGSAANPTQPPPTEPIISPALPAFSAAQQQQPTKIYEDSNNRALATAARLGNTYTIFTTDFAGLDENAVINVNPNDFTIIEEGENFAIGEATYIAGGVEKFLFIYFENLALDETIGVVLTRNSNIAGGETIQAFGSAVSGTIPKGDLTYRGYNLVSNTDQTFTDAGSFTMRVNFENERASISASGDNTFMEATNINVNSRSGTFSTESATIGFINGSSTGGVFNGNFHGVNAKGVTGVYLSDESLDLAGGIAGSR